jgi:tetratricopeptide (TPR) repeat protein
MVSRTWEMQNASAMKKTGLSVCDQYDGWLDPFSPLLIECARSDKSWRQRRPPYPRRGGEAVTDKTRKQQLEEMLLEEPGDSFLRYGLAMEFVSEGNDSEAINHLHALLQADPAYVPGYHQCGLALVRSGQIDEAREVLREGIVAAQQQGNLHAAEEMGGLLATLE